MTRSDACDYADEPLSYGSAPAPAGFDVAHMLEPAERWTRTGPAGD